MAVGKIGQFVPGTSNWKTYISRLEQYFIVNKVEEEMKVPTLITLVGDETYELMMDLCSPDNPEDKTYAELVKIVKNHLHPEPSIIAERHKFRQRRQEKGESITQFMAALKNLAKTCAFKESLDDNLRDQLVSGLASDVIKQRLFSEKSLNYMKAYQLARAMEQAEYSASMVENGTQNVNFVNRSKVKEEHGSSLSRSKGQRSKAGRTRTHGQSSRRGKETAQPRVCMCCGRKNHKTRDCFYLNSNCMICGEKGHLKYVCKKARNGNKSSNYFVQNNDSNVELCSTVKELDSDSSDNLFSVFCSNAKTYKPIRLKVTVENVDLLMDVDTGSGVSLIPESIYEESFSLLPVHQSKLKLSSYNASEIKMLGYIIVNVNYKGVTKQLKLYVVPEGGPPLLGRQWLNELKINIINNEAVNQITVKLNEVTSTNKIDSNVCNNEKLLDSLIVQYKSVFDNQLGKLKNCQAKLYLKEDSVPVFCRARPLPFSMKARVENELERLCSEGILTPIDHSEWATAIVPVIKKDGQVRICGDFRISVNPNLNVHKYPIPKIEDIFASLSGGKLFSKIDLSQAYAQIELDDDSKKLVVINTHKGLYMYNRLPYGIASSPSIFQKLMDQLFGKMEGVFVFLDDILITGRNGTEHLNRLKQVFSKLQECGLKVKLDKCSFFQKSVSYLGFIIDAEGLHPSSEKTAAIAKMKIPQNKSELKSFLGLVNYYGKFLPNLSLKLKNLFALLRKNARWKWSKPCQAEFDLVKEELMSEKVLVHYNPNLPVTLACDASPYGIGAVISHVFPNGLSRPIAHASRTLSEAERNYAQIDREALAIIFGVKKFHQYLFGRNFTLITDNKPLMQILDSKKGIPQLAASRLQRWSILLSAYQYDIKCVKSEKNTNADTLSRLPMLYKAKEKIDLGHILYIEESLPITYKTISSETRKDKILNKVFDYTMNGWPNDPDKCEFELKPYWNRKSELHIEQGCILWGFRVIVPEKLRKAILNEIHSSHFGIVKSKSIVRSFCYWPQIDKDITLMCNSCSACKLVTSHPPKTILQPWPQASKPWERLHADFLGPLYGQKYFAITDAFTKWPEIFKIKHNDARTTINCLRSLFARFGIPDYLVTDNGPPFRSSEFEKFLIANGVKHLYSPPYHPPSNGAAENCVKNFKLAIKKAHCENTDLNLAMYRYLFDYRNTQHTTTGSSPAFLMFGRELKSRLHLMKPDLKKFVNNKIQKQIDNHKGNYSKQFDIGAPVYIRDYRHSQESSWIPGKIENKLGNVIYDVKLGEDKVVRRHSNQIISRQSLAYPTSDESVPNVDKEITVNQEPNDLHKQDEPSVSGAVEPRYNLRPRVKE